MRISLGQLGPAIRSLLVFTILLGIAYPLAMTGVAQVFFNHKADGSLVEANGSVVGSSLIGQEFTGPQYFRSRPSAGGYDPLASGASNLGPNNPDLLKQIEHRRAMIARLDGTDPAQVAPDALTASASGLDPDISPEYADQQVSRVAQARGLDVSVVQDLVDRHTDGRELGFLGEPTVNVMSLNLALDQLAGGTH